MRKKKYKITAFVSDITGDQLDALAIATGSKTKAIESAINKAFTQEPETIEGQYKIFLEVQKAYIKGAETKPETFGPLLQPLAEILSKYAEILSK